MTRTMCRDNFILVRPSILRSYELHDFYLYYMLRAGFELEKIYRLACETFEGMYDKEDNI